MDKLDLRESALSIANEFNQIVEKFESEVPDSPQLPKDGQSREEFKRALRRADLDKRGLPTVVRYLETI
jgi:hypothetical protein